MNKNHGSPYDRGGADRYHGRPYKPHWIEYVNGRGFTVNEEDMTVEQISEYKAGWNTELGRKDLGDGMPVLEQADVE